MRSGATRCRLVHLGGCQRAAAEAQGLQACGDGGAGDGVPARCHGRRDGLRRPSRRLLPVLLPQLAQLLVLLMLPNQPDRLEAAA